MKTVAECKWCIDNGRSVRDYVSEMLRTYDNRKIGELGMSKVEVPLKENIVVKCEDYLTDDDVCQFDRTLKTCDWACLNLTEKEES